MLTAYKMRAFTGYSLKFSNSFPIFRNIIYYGSIVDFVFGLNNPFEELLIDHYQP